MTRSEITAGAWLLAFMLICALISSAAGAEQAPGPLSPSEEKASFHFADSDLDIELVAAEPDIDSPVAIAWDADARLYVAEMSDYPNSRERGRIKLMEDKDGDGRFERVTVFAAGLPFPNGVLPWKNGVLVTAAPDIWFLSDTNADGIADERRRILTGFAEGNQQLRVNGLTWGLDNWIYVANGRSDGDVRWADQTNSQAVSMRGHDLRFRPDTRQLEAIAGRSQFGVARDDWGNRFLSWNTIAIRHEVLPERYLNRNRFLATTESVLDIIEPGDNGRVYPLTPAPLTFNSESTTHFNALAGLTIYRGDALGEKYRGNAFVGESLRNLVHRRVLEESGPTFSARRSEREMEFLASTDPWFHPVNFATGPDGGLYVVDFYRQFVEHPDYVRGKAREEMPWRTGAGHGRIWRVGLKKKPAKAGPRGTTNEELVRGLENRNGWWRDTAQRLLVERQDRSAKALLEKMARSSGKPEARVHALYTLDGLNALDVGVIKAALAGDDVRVRVAALRLASDVISRGRQEARGTLAESVRELVDQLTGGSNRREKVADPSSEKPGDRSATSSRRLLPPANGQLRFQLALTVGDFDEDWKYETLARLAQHDFTNRWHSTAILSGLGKSPWIFLRELVKIDAAWLKGIGPDQRRFMDQVANLVGANHSEDEFKDFLALASSNACERSTRFTLFAGFADGVARSRSSSSRMAEAVRGVPNILGDAASATVERKLEAPVRLAALRILVRGFGLLPKGDFSGIVQKLLRPDEPAELQTAAASAFGQINDGSLATDVFANWSSYAVPTRRQLLAAAVRTSAGSRALVSALESGDVSILEADASIRQSLQKKNDADLKPRIAQLFQGLTSTNREALVREFQPTLALSGDRRRGAATFVRLCLSCHVVGSEGGRVGPELSGISTRPADAILVDILDPSRQVAPEYVGYVVTTVDGQALTGLLVSETAASITLRRQGQPDETIMRTQIKQLRADGKSLMPDGLEAGLGKEEVADLIAFLRGAD